MAEREARYPGRAPIDAYGNGGFRFAEMSHRGSLLLLPSGIYAWAVDRFDDLVESDFARVFGEAGSIDFLLLGTGDHQRFPSAAIREAFAAAGVGLEVMGTGAACRTYNVLLAEQRAVAAALIAVA
ncbi:MAG: MTH938/NDUFAF3 family protein [Hyphomicrobiales bacterium]|nr:MTH938/NDUFAF3 family protein [Hyphomicrobiales bacterium]